MDAGARRDAILDRAAHLMKEKGFAGMSARELAGALEFSKANFFYHLKSKEELLYQIFVETLEYTVRHVEEILARPDDAPAKLRALVDFYVRLMMERSAVMLVWFKERGHLTSEHGAGIAETEDRLLGMLNDFYERGIQDGVFRGGDPRVVRMAIFGMCFNLTRVAHLRDEFPVQAVSEQIQQLACDGLINSSR